MNVILSSVGINGNCISGQYVKFQLLQTNKAVSKAVVSLGSLREHMDLPGKLINIQCVKDYLKP